MGVDIITHHHATSSADRVFGGCTRRFAPVSSSSGELYIKQIVEDMSGR